MLHIFLSNRPGDVRYGTSGKPVPGYDIRLVDEDGKAVAKGEIGELQVSGSTGAAFYWNNRDKSRNTFIGPWTKSGDKYIESDDGYFTYCGRADDMLKVSGIWVSPFEVEAALASHEAVLEAAVVGQGDDNGLIKPKAFVVLRNHVAQTPELAAALQQHVKSRLAPYKYPRWIEFVADLPKTATGKIQRFKLRAAGNP
jgi:benzoate-CoA ligase